MNRKIAERAQCTHSPKDDREGRRRNRQSCVFPVQSSSRVQCRQNNLSETRRVLKELLTWPELEATLKATMTLLPGGYHRPRDCESPKRLAIIIPFRDREENLKVLLNNLHRVLQKQQAEYAIFVVEQETGTPFNRGLIKNIGYVEASALCHFDCFTFHDVDLVTESEKNTYWCGPRAVHHARKLDIWNYRQLQDKLFGGVLTFNETFFSTINGYSNLFFMWGAEDDDLFDRMLAKHLPFEISKYSRYTTLGHARLPKEEEKKWAVYRPGKNRYDSDGLSNMGGIYRLISVDYRPLYTRIYVSVNHTDVMARIKGYGIKV
ncbi:beta-1,4-N-acetylgalactosaminyltransferase bre-4-like [Haliotis asinina]|uniref:beta-1,4-N-acetylgalactosaminyltransferase bre-4-like n=1 Tax=Haliotis asinina TaxID=109174 RepID=UPI0035321436